MWKKIIDLKGKKFHRLEVLSYGNKKGNKHYWNCLCDCGNKKLVWSGGLKNGMIKSCGCLHKEILSTKRGKNNCNWKGYEEISGDFISRKKDSARNRDIKFSLTCKYLYRLLLKQNKKCKLSGMPIYFTDKARDRNENTASLDRIDSSKGYIKSNVQWTHKKINMMKGSLSDKDFIQYCKLVAAHNI